ncbi:MAG: PhzF family phenazine biosynthesis protein [Chloroflexota bacterium]
MSNPSNQSIAGGSLYRLSAFSTKPQGGNPAGVWVGPTLPAAAIMQQIAAQVGYSETAFISPQQGIERIIRYYSPQKEIDFCGHATIASGVLLGELDGDGEYRFNTRVGVVPVRVQSAKGQRQASLTSVEPRSAPAPSALVEGALDCLHWKASDLDPSIPPARAFAGAWHLVLAVKTAARLADLHYDFERLKQLMLAEDLTTLQLVWRENDELFHARNPFPVGGVVEDPATGAAAAALGGYLRKANLLQAPTSFTIHQGKHIGRPSHLFVQVPLVGGIIVSGTAVHLEIGKTLEIN